jgi:hypothetical protein
MNSIDDSDDTIGDEDDALDQFLDTLDVIEAERRMADPNDQSVPFIPTDYE